MAKKRLSFEDLKVKWHSMYDLDRAQEVQRIHQAGVSLAKLARELNCSPSLLSRLAQAATASPEDMEEARRGGMSIRELARRARLNESRGSFSNPESIAFEIERAAVLARRAMEGWFDGPEASLADRERTLVQTQLELAEVQHRSDAEKVNTLLRKIDDMIASDPGRQSRDGRIEFSAEDSVKWAALWLAHWIVRNLPEERVRIRVIEQALTDLRKAPE